MKVSDDELEDKDEIVEKGDEVEESSEEEVKRQPLRKRRKGYVSKVFFNTRQNDEHKRI